MFFQWCLACLVLSYLLQLFRVSIICSSLFGLSIWIEICRLWDWSWNEIYPFAILFSITVWKLTTLETAKTFSCHLSGTPESDLRFGPWRLGSISIKTWKDVLSLNEKIDSQKYAVFTLLDLSEFAKTLRSHIRQKRQSSIDFSPLLVNYGVLDCTAGPKNLLWDMVI